MLLLWVGVLSEAVNLGQRRADYIINDAAKAAKFLDIIKASDLHDVSLVLEAARHTARFDDETCGIGDNGLFKADLRAISKAGHHGRVLSPLIGKAFLGRWVAVRI